jgi:hypothetical protein
MGIERWILRALPIVAVFASGVVLLIGGEDAVKEYGRAVLMLGALLVLMYTRRAVIADASSYAKEGEIAGILLVAAGTLFSTGIPGGGWAILWAGGGCLLFALHHLSATRTAHGEAKRAGKPGS